MSTLLCLLSDQRMQNVIPLLQRGLRFDRVYLVASGEDGRVNPRFARIADDFKAALPEVRWHLHPQPVDPMTPTSTRQACLDILAACGGAQRVTINFTGGTKPMSIGAFQAGLESCARMLYVDTQAEQIFHYQDGQPTSQPFDLQPLQALPFLRLHGRQVDPVCMAQNRLTLDRTEESLARLILNRRPHSLPAVVRLRERVLKAPPIGEGGRGLPLSAQRACPWLCDALRQVGYASYDQDQLILDVGAVKFLDGGWLEAYTYLALRQSRALVDVVCRLKLSGVENELDVACTLNAKLGVIECKSGSLKGPTGQAALNRLRALRDSLGGVFGKAFLIIGQNSADLPEVFQRRAAEYVSRIIGLEDLHRVEDLVQEEMSRKRR